MKKASRGVRARPRWPRGRTRFPVDPTQETWGRRGAPWPVHPRFSRSAAAGRLVPVHILCFGLHFLQRGTPGQLPSSSSSSCLAGPLAAPSPCLSPLSFRSQHAPPQVTGSAPTLGTNVICAVLASPGLAPVQVDGPSGHPYFFPFPFPSRPSVRLAIFSSTEARLEPAAKLQGPRFRHSLLSDHAPALSAQEAGVGSLKATVCHARVTPVDTCSSASS